MAGNKLCIIMNTITYLNKNESRKRKKKDSADKIMKQSQEAGAQNHQPAFLHP